MSVQPLVIVVSATPLEQELKEYDEEVPSMVERILRKKGPEILSVVGEAPIFQMQEMREFPSFTRDEIDFGQVLGVGAFGVVREVARIYTKEQSDDASCRSEQPSLSSSWGDLHYDISTARQNMVKKCLRRGDARYAVKYLRTNAIDEDERALGRIDLAIEIKYLHALDHPNIIKMRGVFETADELHPDRFFLMDRLYGTLEDKIEEWGQIKLRNSTRGVAKFMSKIKRAAQDNETMQKLMVTRLTVAHDIASAFKYMHAHQLVYRDVKHRNIGFDVRGDVKIFDFGLAKSMHPKLRTPNGLYRFTALTGSIPYMAPEVAASQPYNEKSDVYSFGMLFWAILSLKSPWCAFPSLKDDIGGYTRLVVNSGTRPLIKSKWPRLARHVLKSSFMKSAEARPSMSKICGMLSTDLVELAKEESIHQRTQNMMAASWNSDSVEDEEAVDIF